MKKIFFIAVALMAFATMSFAQVCDYDPQTGVIKIWKPDPRFSVSASKQVYFSKGNLQYNSATQEWQFATHQYDYIGNTSGNTAVTADGLANNNGIADLFGWVGASSSWTGLKQYGLTSANATKENAVDGYGTGASENLKSDWGTLMGSGWRTLTGIEWQYMILTRTGDHASIVGSTENVRFAKATVNSVYGIILFPDGETFETSEFTVVGSLNGAEASYSTTTCTLLQWQALEKKGCIFLPAAGKRGSASVSDAGSAGGYWSSESYPDNVKRARNCVFTDASLNPYNYVNPNNGRASGYSVRLVKDVE